MGQEIDPTCATCIDGVSHMTCKLGDWGTRRRISLVDGYKSLSGQHLLNKPKGAPATRKPVHQDHTFRLILNEIYRHIGQPPSRLVPHISTSDRPLLVHC